MGPVDSTIATAAAIAAASVIMCARGACEEKPMVVSLSECWVLRQDKFESLEVVRLDEV